MHFHYRFKQITLAAIGLGTFLAPAAVSPAQASPALMLDTSSFQAGPGKSDDSLGRLDAGDRVEVIWCATQGQCLVQIHNRQGWVPLALLNLKPGRKPNAADAFGGGGSSSNSGGGGNSGSGPRNPADPASIVMAPMAPKANDGGGIVYSPVINIGN